MGAEAYPLYWPDGWKRTTAYRKKSAFKIAGFGKARDLLLAEAKRMGGASIVLSTNVSLRNDGLPYANQREPGDPGVAIYFFYKKKQMSFACDAYRTVRENAYAIAKTIEALRGIERWGASDMMERAFTGFTALPAAVPEKRHWREVLGLDPLDRLDPQDISYRYQQRAKARHPDVPGGSHEAMQELNAAREEALKAVRG